VSAVHTELHDLVDQLSEDQATSVLAWIRSNASPLERRERALATLDRVRDRLSGVTGIDEELDRLRDNPRG
jgi:hypothetical protein